MEISKEFVPYKEALELKKLGFNEPCFKGYTEEYGDLINFSNTHTNESVKNTLPTKPFTAPLYQQAFRFFREKFQLGGIPTHQSYDIWNLPSNERYLEEYPFNSYKEAELACLRKLIEITK